MSILMSLKYSLHIIFHPFDGFWDLKHEKKGSLKSAFIILVLLCLVYIIRRQLTGILFFGRDKNDFSIFSELLSVSVPFFLWCVSNWCLTTLMDGEGSFKDIIITTAYALTPLIIINAPLILFSNLITLEEGAFYYFFATLSIIWSGALIILGTSVVHQYTLTKTLLTTILIIVGMGIILFIAMLFFNLLEQMYYFISTLYKEFTIRL